MPDKSGTVAVLADITGGTSAGSFTTLSATTVNLDGGTIDGTTIGGAQAGAGYFTTLNSSTGITVAASQSISQTGNYILGTGVVDGELPAGPHIKGLVTGGALTIKGDANGAVGGGTVIGYYNGSTWKSAIETFNIASGNGTLTLMKSGGAITTPGTIYSGTYAFVYQSAATQTNTFNFGAAGTLAYAQGSSLVFRRSYDNVAMLTLDGNGNVTATGTVTASSDERLKVNWRDLNNNFVADLASVKSGIYDRIDLGITQAGVSAQSLQTILPEAVIADSEGILAVAYGNAALVACIELAKEIQLLKAEINKLKG